MTGFIFPLSDSGNALTSVLTTASTEAIFVNAQIASQGAIERATERSERQRELSAPRRDPEDQIDFSERFKELLERANAGRLQSIDREIDRINDKIDEVKPFRSGSDDALRQSGEYRLDLIEAELRRLNVVGNEDLGRNANKLSRQVDNLAIAIDEYTRGTEPSNEDRLASGTIEPITFQDEKFRQRVDKIKRDLESRIRSQAVTANGRDVDERIDVQGRLNTAKLNLRGLNEGFSALDEVLAIKRNAAVNIVV